MELRSNGVQCDNPKCDFKDESVGFDRVIEYLNKPCPKCGANLLTEEDYLNLQIAIATFNLIKANNPEVATLDRNKPYYKIEVETHKKIKLGEPILINDKKTENE